MREGIMKRIVGTVLLALPVLLAPVAALAQEGSGLNPPRGPSVGGVGGVRGSVGGTGDLAFTGAEIAQLIAFAVALVMVGATALMLARRRRAVRVEA
jgi:hypothetical protein